MSAITKLLTGAKITKTWLDGLIDQVNAQSSVAVTLTSGYSGSCTLDIIGQLRILNFNVTAASNASNSVDLVIATITAADDRPLATRYGNAWISSSPNSPASRAGYVSVATTGGITVGATPGLSSVMKGSLAWVAA